MINYIRTNKIKILVTIILFVSIFMFQYSKEADAIDSREEYDADILYERNALALYIYGADNMYECMDAFRLKDCTTSIVENIFYLNAANSCYMTDVIVSGENYFLPIIKGSYPSRERLSTGEPCAVLGQDLYKLTYNQNGKTYIDIHGEKYEVTGFVSAPNSAIYDHRVILFFDCLGAKAKADLEYYFHAIGFNIIISNETISARAISEQLDPDDYTYILYHFSRFVESDSVPFQYRQYADLIYVFSIITIILIVYLWMLLRKREFAVKKAFGYSSFKLLYEITSEIIVMISVAVILSEVTLMIFNLLSRELIWFSSERLIFRLINIFKYTITTLPVLMIVPAISLFVNNPIKLLTDKDI